MEHESNPRAGASAGAGGRRVVLLAGAAHGIGRATALLAANRGIALAACDTDPAGLEALRAVLGPGSDALLTHADITSAESLAEFVAATRQKFGRVDAAICNAGGMISLVHQGAVSSNVRRFMDIPTADWQKILNLNLVGAMNLAQAVLPGMIEAGAGRLVFVASVSGLVGAAGLSVYAAAKGGVVAFAKSLVREQGENGISVNCVAPGGIATRAFPAGSASLKSRLERIPLKRLGMPEEVADVIMYLATAAPEYLTGEVISVAGGPP